MPDLVADKAGLVDRLRRLEGHVLELRKIHGIAYSLGTHGGGTIGVCVVVRRSLERRKAVHAIWRNFFWGDNPNQR